MLGKAPEISETLEWMLQSRQVGDELLVKTLVHEQYLHICRFVSLIISSHDFPRCERIAEQVVFESVEDASGYQGKMSVQAWLFKKVVTETRRMEESLWNDEQLSRRLLSRIGGKKHAMQYLQRTGLSSSEMFIALKLFFLFDFNPSEIAMVIDGQEALVAELIEQSEKFNFSSDDATEDHTPARVEIPKNLDDGWRSENLDNRTANQISRRVLNRLQTKDRRKRRAVVVGEGLLAILAIILVAGMGDLISWFAPEPTPEFVYETRMVNQIVFVSPTPGPTQPPTPFPEKAIIYEAIEGETLLDIAGKIYFNAQILAALNQISIEQPLRAGQQIMIGISESRILMPTSDSPDSIPQVSKPTPEQLTIQSDDKEIRQRIASSDKYWHTLWADALVIQYGPPGYTGEPEFKRQQIWIDQPYFHYLLEGINGGEVEFAYSVVGGWENLLNVQTGSLQSNVGPQELNFQPDLKQMLIHSEFDDDFAGEIEIIRQDQVAGRDVLVLDWYPESSSLRGSGFKSQPDRELQGRYWIDTHLGSILRVQKFSGNSPKQLFKDTMISKVIFNVPIPSRLYDRSQYLQTYFAKDHTGNYVHEPIAIPEDIALPRQVVGTNQYQPPPPGFEINESRLDFHWTSLNRFSPEEGTRVDLFADGYYVGNIDFAEPEQLTCSRSPDGGRLAFTSWSDEQDFGYMPLSWVILKSLPEVQHFNPGLIPYDFAFSPDSQQLAVYACQRFDEQTCGVYLVEVNSGDSRLLRAVEQGTGLIWSPDGKAIAIQGSYLKEGKWRLLVLSSRSGNGIYEGPFDWEGFWVAHDSPIHEWGVQYPPLRGGLELCTLPPHTD